MKISIITAAYNSEKTIRDTLESINKQSYKNIEHIIIDGKSSDSTLNIINNYDHNKIVISESDEGIYDAMNKGINMATGDIIGILNSDDIYENENSIEKIVNCFIESPKIDYLFGNLYYCSNQNMNIKIRNWKSCNYYDKFFEDGRVPPHPTLYVKSYIYKSIQLFDISFSLASDYEFMLRLFKKSNYTPFFLNEYLIRMRLGGATNKNLNNIVKQNFEILKAWRKNGFEPSKFFLAKRIFQKLKQYL